MADTKQEIPHLREIDFAEIEEFSIVGRGSYGTVYKARWQNQFVAVKGFEFEADSKAIETEIKQLSRVVHQNIIVLYGVSIADSRIYLVMEYAENGSLHTVLHGALKPFYSAAHAMSWARQCAEGVAYLHGMRPKPLIHRDLKPLNLLLVNDGRNLKICDFGTVADKSTLMTNNKGSAAWMAPEVFRGVSYTEKCDVFSWAIILWQIITREQPYKDFGNAFSIMWYVNQGHRPPSIEGCPKPIERLMIACWDQDPEKRPSMENVVEIMRIFCEFFPGADEPLDYKTPHKEEENKTEETDKQSVETENQICFENLSLTSSTTPTNSTHHIEPINNEVINQHEDKSQIITSTSDTNNLKSPIFKGDELDTLPKEIESKWTLISNDNNCSNDNQKDIDKSKNPYQNINFNNNNNIDDDEKIALTEFQMNPSRIIEIRNGMLKNQHLPMKPLSIQVDPNAWELKHDYNKILENISKSDGKERLTITEKLTEFPAISQSDTVTNNDNSENNSDNDSNVIIGGNDDTEKALHLMLDPELQPEAPDQNSELSQEIFHEHQKLAKEYLRIDTELYYAEDQKEKILASMDPKEKQEKLTIIKKLMEKEELLGLYKDLKRQLEQIKAGQGLSTNSTQQQEILNQQHQQQQLQQMQQTVDPQQQQQLEPASPEPPDQNEDGWVFISSANNQS